MLKYLTVPDSNQQGVGYFSLRKKMEIGAVVAVPEFRVAGTGRMEH